MYYLLWISIWFETLNYLITIRSSIEQKQRIDDWGKKEDIIWEV